MNDAQSAILHLDRAVHWYFPGNPYVRRSLSDLWEIGQTTENADRRTALSAYDAARGGIFSVRSFFQPYEDRLPRINQRIAELRTREQIERHPEEKYTEVLEFHRKALERDERPRLSWSLLAVAGFIAWTASTFGLIWRGFDREGRMQLRSAVPWMTAIVLGFAGWILGLIRA